MSGNDGGPAFPDHAKDGMTLRDYFAARADVPWNAVIETFRERKGVERDPTSKELFELRSQLKYQEADAMLKERDK